MPEISKIQLPSGTIYDLKDATARSMAQAGVTFSVSHDAASTPYGVTWDNNGTTVTGTLVASEDTAGIFYLVPATTQGGSKDIYSEYITVTNTEMVDNGGEITVNNTYSWEKIGTTDVDLSNLGDLAYKDTASGSFTPSGSVSAPTFTGTSFTSTGSFTPSGAISVGGESGTAYTPQGTIAVNAGGGSGTSYTPTGAIVVNASSGSGTSYTPEGSVAAPGISVKTAGATTTIHNPTKATVATAVTAASPGSTAPNNSITYYSVSNETLSLYQIGYNTGDSITTSDVTVKTGDAVYQATKPTFTGTEKKLAFSGDTKKLVFTGTQTKIAFTGTSDTVSVSGTPTGSVSSPTFTGTAGTVTVS